MAQKIVEERIRRLFELAENRFFEGRKRLADRYVQLARDIGMSYNVSIPSELKQRMCQECHSYLVPGKSCTVRIDSKQKTIGYSCENCGHKNRYGF